MSFEWCDESVESLVLIARSLATVVLMKDRWGWVIWQWTNKPVPFFNVRHLLYGSGAWQIDDLPKHRFSLGSYAIILVPNTKIHRYRACYLVIFPKWSSHLNKEGIVKFRLGFTL